MLHIFLTLLINCMVIHGLWPPELLNSTIVSIPKDNRGSLSNSEKYRGIALSNFICKIIDTILLNKYSMFLATSTLLWWNYTAQSFHKLKVAFNNAFRMMHNIPTYYCSASEMFTANRVADCKAVIRNLVHRFMMRLTISKHLLVRSILSSDVVCSSRIRRHWARLFYVHYLDG